MGRVAAELADRVIVTSDNPRTEDPGTIIDEVLTGVQGGGAGSGGRPHDFAQGGKVVARATITIEPDREAAIRLAVREAAPGDTIIIAGKGHEDYQILPDPARKGATITRHFDDREVARAALRERGIAAREPKLAHPTTDDDGGEDRTAGASLALGG
jgi:UDP-N-acetylmuramoyl-L-alanyl-D-glutamate--2,6-diaminopimelate ligase